MRFSPFSNSTSLFQQSLSGSTRRTVDDERRCSTTFRLISRRFADQLTYALAAKCRLCRSEPSEFSVLPSRLVRCSTRVCDPLGDVAEWMKQKRDPRGMSGTDMEKFEDELERRKDEKKDSADIVIRHPFEPRVFSSAAQNRRQNDTSTCERGSSQRRTTFGMHVCHHSRIVVSRRSKPRDGQIY